MSGHTKEPWIAYQDGKREMNNINHFIKSAAGDLVTYGHLSELDAIRIVACVNACAGIPTSRLEAGAADILAYSMDLKKERDELLDELKLIANAKPQEWDEEVRDQFEQWAKNRARFAIAKAERA